MALYLKLVETNIRMIKTVGDITLKFVTVINMSCHVHKIKASDMFISNCYSAHCMWKTAQSTDSICILGFTFLNGKPNDKRKQNRKIFYTYCNCIGTHRLVLGICRLRITSINTPGLNVIRMHHRIGLQY